MNVDLTNYLVFEGLDIKVTFIKCLANSCIKTDAIDDTQTRCTHLKENPAILLYIVELLSEQVDIEMSFCSAQ